jgi:DNA-directed RNA polymerase specialized sigma24 family protein
MNDQERLIRFEAEMLPLMHDAYNVARWLVQNDEDARDVVQEAYLRAFKFFGGMRSDTGKPWLLRIVRKMFVTVTLSSDKIIRQIVSIERKQIPVISRKKPCKVNWTLLLFARF